MEFLQHIFSTIKSEHFKEMTMKEDGGNGGEESQGGMRRVAEKTGTYL